MIFISTNRKVATNLKLFTVKLHRLKRIVACETSFMRHVAWNEFTFWWSSTAHGRTLNSVSKSCGVKHDVEHVYTHTPIRWCTRVPGVSASMLVLHLHKTPAWCNFGTTGIRERRAERRKVARSATRRRKWRSIWASGFASKLYAECYQVIPYYGVLLHIIARPITRGRERSCCEPDNMRTVSI